MSTLLAYQGKVFGVHIPNPVRKKPAYLLRSLREGLRNMGIQHVVMTGQHYQPCDFLFFYGWGGLDRQAIINGPHKGKPYCAFDLGYWDRAGMQERSWRVSLDGFHCPHLIGNSVCPDNGERRKRFKMNIRPAGGSSNGPIVLVGNAPKSQQVIEAGWTQKKSREIRKAFPGVRIVYRPKPGRPPEKWVSYDTVGNGPIQALVAGSRLVVARHSNVAVDACIAGVPVVCEDGAAACIYPHSLADWEQQPSVTERVNFLDKLAWWQWKGGEISNGAFLRWLEQWL